MNELLELVEDLRESIKFAEEMISLGVSVDFFEDQRIAAKNQLNTLCFEEGING
jgi:hypothetical protein